MNNIISLNPLAGVETKTRWGAAGLRICRIARRPVRPVGREQDDEAFAKNFFEVFLICSDLLIWLIYAPLWYESTKFKVSASLFCEDFLLFFNVFLHRFLG